MIRWSWSYFIAWASVRGGGILICFCFGGGEWELVCLSFQMGLVHSLQISPQAFNQAFRSGAYD